MDTQLNSLMTQIRQRLLDLGVSYFSVGFSNTICWINSSDSVYWVHPGECLRVLDALDDPELYTDLDDIWAAIRKINING